MLRQQPPTLAKRTQRCMCEGVDKVLQVCNAALRPVPLQSANHYACGDLVHCRLNAACVTWECCKAAVAKHENELFHEFCPTLANDPLRRPQCMITTTHRNYQFKSIQTMSTSVACLGNTSTVATKQTATSSTHANQQAIARSQILAWAGYDIAAHAAGRSGTAHHPYPPTPDLSFRNTTDTAMASCPRPHASPSEFP